MLQIYIIHCLILPVFCLSFRRITTALSLGIAWLVNFKFSYESSTKKFLSIYKKKTVQRTYYFTQYLLLLFETTININV